MNKKILIVEDQFIEANHLRIMLNRAGYEICGVARSVEQGEEMVEKEKPGLVLLDIFLNGTRTGIELAEQLKEANIPFIFLSANSNEEVLNAAKATHPNGFLVKPFREKDLLIAIQIAEYRHENSLESRLRKEMLFQKQLAAITTERLELEQKLIKIAQVLQPLFSFDMMTAGYASAGDFMPDNTLHFLRIGFNEYQVLSMEGFRVVTNLKSNEFSSLQLKTLIGAEIEAYTGAAFDQLVSGPSLRKLIASTFDMVSHLSFPLQATHRENKVFFLEFFNRRPDAYQEEHKALCYRVMPALSLALQHLNRMDKSSLKENIHPDPEQSHAENHGNAFHGIIGQSHLLLNVFDLISQVAPAETSVLVTGESGTGKERIADAIHALSQRKSNPLIKVNCAALPTNLIESELFGHEKGAFTGAFEKRIGRFEQANNGTIFLDEIGDMPLEAQVKLLRVLQQKEIERIGGKAPIKVNIRVIAATNRNLEKEVAEGRFRLDLYYRLNVFPIHLPALADRKQDIPLLVNHFIQYYGRKTGRRCTGISETALKNLFDYHWPGNIRELENVIERSMLMAKSNIIESVSLPVQQVMKTAIYKEDSKLKTIFDNERDHIIEVLKKCNGRIRGVDGAAAILGIPPTTLGSKMKKLGIKKDYLI